MVSLTAISIWIADYQYFFYLLIFPFMVLEGPIITVAAGFFTSLGELNFWAIYILAIAANLTSDTIIYTIGRWGYKFWGFLKLTPEKLEDVKKHFQKHKIKTLIAGKFALGIGNVALAAAGVAKMPFWNYLGINFLIEIPKTLIFFLVGFYFGRAYDLIDKYLKLATETLIIGSVTLFLCYWLLRHLMTRYYKKL